MAYLAIPAGLYRAKAVDVYLEHPEGKQERIVVTFRFTENGPNGEPAYGQDIKWMGFFSDKAFQHTVRALRHCGWVGDDIGDLSTILEQNGGSEVQLEIEQGEFNGKMQTRVKWVNHRDGAKPATMSDAQRAAFAARMRGKVLMAGQIDPTLAAPTSASPPPARAPAAAPDNLNDAADAAALNVPF